MMITIMIRGVLVTVSTIWAANFIGNFIQQLRRKAERNSRINEIISEVESLQKEMFKAGRGEEEYAHLPCEECKSKINEIFQKIFNLMKEQEKLSVLNDEESLWKNIHFSKRLRLPKISISW